MLSLSSLFQTITLAKIAKPIIIISASIKVNIMYLEILLSINTQLVLLFNLCPRMN